MTEPSPTSDKAARRPLQIFLCHSSDDKPAVRRLYRKLVEDGFRPWLDEEDLLPGQHWEREIPIAVKNSDVVIACLSRQSATKTGYVQKEIKFALDVADEQPEGTIFLIPLRLEQCEVPQRLSRLHWVDLFEATGYDKLVRALDTRSQFEDRRDITAASRVNLSDVVSLDAALLQLKVRTKLLYPAMVECVRKKASTGDASIRNPTIRAIQSYLDQLKASGCFKYFLASSDLSGQTTNRIDFQITNAPQLEAAIERVERSSGRT